MTPSPVRPRTVLIIVLLLLLAATAGSAATGAAVMAVFVLGTAPMFAGYGFVTQRYVNPDSRRTFEIRYYSALFEALPDRSAIVLDQYNINMMVFYKLLGEGAARGREIVTVPQSHEEVSARIEQGRGGFARIPEPRETAGTDAPSDPPVWIANDATDFALERRRVRQLARGREAQEAIQMAGEKRFILSTGCVIPITTPYGNIQAARRAVGAA